MKLQSLGINGAHLITHEVFSDSRGYFREWFKSSELSRIDDQFRVAQANYSFSDRNVLRGIHFSIAPIGQAKLVSVMSGEILDVLIDLRKGSSTYLAKEYVSLESKSGKCLFVPSGVGHSFVVKSENAAVSYLTSSEYDPENEKTLNPFDSDVEIEWGVNHSNLLLSDRDSRAPSLKELAESGHLPL